MQGRVFLQCQARARLIVIRCIIGKGSPKVRFAKDDHLVQAVRGSLPYGQKIKTAAKMAVAQASTMKQLSAPFSTAPHGSA